MADWQSHLQRISDFLLLGEGIWWKKSEFGIEFSDKVTQNIYPTKPKVHHFRSSNISKIEKDLEDNWVKLIENNINIPSHQILEENIEKNKVIVKSTNFLQPFIQEEMTQTKIVPFPQAFSNPAMSMRIL